MATEDSAVVEYLACNYSGSVAIQALWQWAGGCLAEIEYVDPPEECWKTMWGKAGAGADAAPIALVREALFDRPGDPLLLGYFSSLPDAEFKERRRATAFLFALIQTLEEDLPTDRLCSLLHVFPVSDVNETLVVWAPAMQGKLDDARRRVLEERFREIQIKASAASSAQLVYGIKYVRAFLAKTVEQNINNEEFTALSKEFHALLNRWLEFAEEGEASAPIAPMPGAGETAVTGAEGAAATAFASEATAFKTPEEKRALREKIRQAVESRLIRFEEWSAESSSSVYREGTAAMRRLFICLSATVEGLPSPSLAPMAEAGIQALWATLAPPPKITDAPPEPAATAGATQ
jgi:hypothetical protein